MAARRLEACTLILLPTDLEKQAEISQRQVTGESFTFLSLIWYPPNKKWSSCANTNKALVSEILRELRIPATF